MALARYLPAALELFVPDVAAQIDWSRGYTLLDKELQQVTRDADLGRRLADMLVQLWRRDGTEAWVLIHLEVQGQPEPAFAQRMYVYNYRIFDRYERPVMSLAILADEQPAWRPDHYRQELWGCTIEMRYPVVKLLEWRAREQELSTSRNPFAVVVQAHLAAQATRDAAGARVQAKIGVIRGLLARGYERDEVLELLRLIDWLIALPVEDERLVVQAMEQLEEEQRMTYVTSWERMGQERGEAIGRAEGLVEGLTVCGDQRGRWRSAPADCVPPGGGAALCPRSTPRHRSPIPGRRHRAGGLPAVLPPTLLWITPARRTRWYAGWRKGRVRDDRRRLSPAPPAPGGAPVPAALLRGPGAAG